MVDWPVCFDNDMTLFKVDHFQTAKDLLIFFGWQARQQPVVHGRLIKDGHETSMVPDEACEHPSHAEICRLYNIPPLSMFLGTLADSSGSGRFDILDAVLCKLLGRDTRATVALP